MSRSFCEELYIEKDHYKIEKQNCQFPLSRLLYIIILLSLVFSCPALAYTKLSTPLSIECDKDKNLFQLILQRNPELKSKKNVTNYPNRKSSYNLSRDNYIKDRCELKDRVVTSVIYLGSKKTIKIIEDDKYILDKDIGYSINSGHKVISKKKGDWNECCEISCQSKVSPYRMSCAKDDSTELVDKYKRLKKYPSFLEDNDSFEVEKYYYYPIPLYEGLINGYSYWANMGYINSKDKGIYGHLHKINILNQSKEDLIKLTKNRVSKFKFLAESKDYVLMEDRIYKGISIYSKQNSVRLGSLRLETPFVGSSFHNGKLYLIQQNIDDEKAFLSVFSVPKLKFLKQIDIEEILHPGRFGGDAVLYSTPVDKGAILVTCKNIIKISYNGIIANTMPHYLSCHHVKYFKKKYDDFIGTYDWDKREYVIYDINHLKRNMKFVVHNSNKNLGVRHVYLSGNKVYLFLNSSLPNDTTKMIEVFDLDSQKYIKSLPGIERDITLYNVQDKLVATKYLGGESKIWIIKTKKQRR